MSPFRSISQDEPAKNDSHVVREGIVQFEAINQGRHRLSRARLYQETYFIDAFYW